AGIATSYGTVGNWPASSCASRAALSPFSWAAFSLGTNLPVGAALGLLELVPELVELADVPLAALPTAELMTVPPRAPPMIDPARTVARIHFFAIFMGLHLLSRLGVRSGERT